MQDRVSLYPGRVKLEPVAGQANTYDLTRADQPTQEGTPLNKGSLLSDKYGIPYSAETVDDMWGKVVPVGTILWFAKDAPPPGRFLLCDGSAINIDDYPELFEVIGSTFKAATSTIFYLPDLRAAFIRGAGTQGVYSATFGATQDATGVPDRGFGDYETSSFDNYDNSYTGGMQNKYSLSGAGLITVYKTRPFNVALTPIIKY